MPATAGQTRSISPACLSRRSKISGIRSAPTRCRVAMPKHCWRPPAATDIVLVSPVYWFSIPSPLKTYLDHWSGWMRVPDLDFKEKMRGKKFLGDHHQRRPRQSPCDARFLPDVRRISAWNGSAPCGQGRRARTPSWQTRQCVRPRPSFSNKPAPDFRFPKIRHHLQRGQPDWPLLLPAPAPEQRPQRALPSGCDIGIVLVETYRSIGMLPFNP